MKGFIVGKANTKTRLSRFETIEEARAFIRGIDWAYKQLLSNHDCPFATFTLDEWEGL